MYTWIFFFLTVFRHTWPFFFLQCFWIQLTFFFFKKFLGTCDICFVFFSSMFSGAQKILFFIILQDFRANLTLIYFLFNSLIFHATVNIVRKKQYKEAIFYFVMLVILQPIYDLTFQRGHLYKCTNQCKTKHNLWTYQLTQAVKMDDTWNINIML